MRYTVTKKYHAISVGHRLHTADTHCALLHGYGRTVEVTFGCDHLDKNGWVFDFGGLRSFKSFLDTSWDHKFLIASDDPLLEDFKALEKKGAMALTIMDKSKGHGPGIEGSCLFLADFLGPEIQKISRGRAHLLKVEIWEKEENRAALTLIPFEFR